MNRLWIVGLILILTAPVYAGQTLLYYNSDQGDYIGQGQEKYYTIDDLNFVASNNFDNGVTFAMTNFERLNDQASIWWYANFAAPNNAILEEGFYENATRFPFQESNESGLSFYGEGRGCNRLSGSFEIKEVVYDQITGDLSNFAVDFEQHCEGQGSGLYGSIRYNSDVAISTLLPANIKIKNNLNSQSCIEATTPEGATISLVAEVAQENLQYAFEWSTSTGEVGDGSSMTFDLGVDENTVVFLSTVDTSTNEAVTSTLPICVSDTTPPKVTILSPVEGEVFVGNNMVLEVEITDIVDKNIENYTVNLGSTNVVMLDPHSEFSSVKLFKPRAGSRPVPAQIIVSVQDKSGNAIDTMVEVLLKHDKRKK